jgi:dienelactone hydrolase
MNRQFGLRSWMLAAVLTALTVVPSAGAQEEIPPPSGKGKLVVVLSGAGGSGTIRDVAARIAQLGYDVALFDSNAIRAARQQGVASPLCTSVMASIAKARELPRALPGKYGIVGFSLGGGMAFSYGCAWTDPPAVVAAWYPDTDSIKDVNAFARRIRIPTVMFAGTADEYRMCCTIDKARAIEKAAKAANRPFELTTYKGVGHAFAQSTSAANYDRSSTDDALQKTAAALKRHLGD